MVVDIEKIYFRVEASSQIGLGNLNRCIFLSKNLNKMGVQPVFLVSHGQEIFFNQVGVDKANIIVLPLSDSYVEEVESYPLDCHFIVLDLYHFKNIENHKSLEGYINRLHDNKICIAFIDGLFEEAFRPDKNIFFDVCMYIQPYLGAENDTPPPAVHWIKGAEYALLGKAYDDLSPKHVKEKARNILITFGGADPQEQTSVVMTALAKNDFDGHVRVIIGPYFSEGLKKQIQDLGVKYPLLFECLGPQDNMLSHYQWADLAIGASGSSRYEFAACGLPAIFSSISLKHSKSSKVFAEYGLACYLGYYKEITQKQWFETVLRLSNDPAVRKEMALKSQVMIKGGGLDRLVVEILNNFKECCDNE